MSSMTADRFSLDAGILFYAVDRTAGEKHRIAAQLATKALDGDCILSLQAVTEFFGAVTRKGKMPLGDAAQALRDWISIFPVVSPTAANLDAALALVTAGRAELAGATQIACLEANECHFLLSEDFGGKARLGQVEIVNPFTRALPKPLAFLLTEVGDDE
jgi:predicted nucleic acid-binding protein